MINYRPIKQQALKYENCNHAPSIRLPSRPSNIPVYLATYASLNTNTKHISTKRKWAFGVCCVPLFAMGTLDKLLNFSELHFHICRIRIILSISELFIERIKLNEIM